MTVPPKENLRQLLLRQMQRRQAFRQLRQDVEARLAERRRRRGPQAPPLQHRNGQAKLLFASLAVGDIIGPAPRPTPVNNALDQ